MFGLKIAFFIFQKILDQNYYEENNKKNLQICKKNQMTYAFIILINNHYVYTLKIYNKN